MFSDTAVTEIALIVIILLLTNISFQLRYIEGSLDDVNEALRQK